MNNLATLSRATIRKRVTQDEVKEAWNDWMGEKVAMPSAEQALLMIVSSELQRHKEEAQERQQRLLRGDFNKQWQPWHGTLQDWNKDWDRNYANEIKTTRRIDGRSE